jgi:HSP20 family protein
MTCDAAKAFLNCSQSWWVMGGQGGCTQAPGLMELTMSALMRTSSWLDDFMKDMTPGIYIKPLHGEGVPSEIRMDVTDVGAAYKIQAEIPGVHKEAIHVSMDGNMVTVSAEVKQEDVERKEDRVLRSERYFGSVSRSFQLPQEVDSAKAKAKYDNGVLSLTLPKRQGGASKELMIE